MSRALVTTIGLCIGSACGSGTVGDAEPHAPRDEAAAGELIGGTPTRARTEIGLISVVEHGSCTATLIAPDVVLTAAHCVGYGSNDVPGAYGWLGLDTATGRKAYTIDRYVSLGRDVGEDDLAILHVDPPVPADIAAPTTIAEVAPALESSVVIYGYGCLERDGKSGSFEKRAADATYQDSQRLCPGDSGGPVTLGADGPIVGINSGYYVGSGEDIFADPVAHRTSIHAQLGAWGPPAVSACLGGDQSNRAAPAPFEGDGKICAARDAWWAIMVTPGQTLVVEVAFSHAAGDIDVGVFAPSGTPVAKSDTTTDAETIRHVVSEPGAHWVHVYGYDGAANAVHVRIAAE